MAEVTKIEVCSNCSGLDVKTLKGKGEVKTSCIGHCSKKCPELDGKVYGFINGVFIVRDSAAEFIKSVDEACPPAMSDNAKNPLVDAFLQHTKNWREEFEKLRAFVLDCGLTEELKWGQPCYTFQRANVLILGGFKDYIALSFFKGVLLKDLSGVLVRQTDNVQEARQFRFTSVQEIVDLEAVIRAYIYEAIEVEKSGLKPIVERRPDITIPEELQNKFDKDASFKAAFEALTPGRQRGYVFHFSGAKQPKTREARIEKCLPLIMDGKGLED